MKLQERLVDRLGSRLSLKHAAEGKQRLHQRALRLEWFTVLWNVIEAGVAIVAGVIAGSTALVAFGADSLIEVTSAVGLLGVFTEREPEPVRKSTARRSARRSTSSPRPSLRLPSTSPTRAFRRYWSGRRRKPRWSGWCSLFYPSSLCPSWPTLSSGLVGKWAAELFRRMPSKPGCAAIR